MKNQQITILKRCGWIGDGDRPLFGKPEQNEQGNGLRSMMGLEEKDKPVINEASLSVEAQMVYNMIPETRQTEEKAKSVKADEQNHNSDEEMKAMLNIGL